MAATDGARSFSKPTETIEFDGILLDMDGTIVDSTNAIVQYWQLVAQDIGVDYREIIRSAHGRRSIDTLRDYDESKANWEYVSHMEGLCPKLFGKDAVEIPGARDLLASLETAEVPWAIVTSGTRPLIQGWLDVMKLAKPKRMVTAEDVQKGKPEPDCYVRGRDLLGGTTEQRYVVVEDAPAGIRAGVAAGCRVIGLATSHAIEEVVQAGPTWIVRDLRSVQFEQKSTGQLLLHISDALGE